VKTEGECQYFGQYDSISASWDAICHSARYFLPFKSAGTQRNDLPPEEGEVFYYFDMAQDDWTSKTYDPAVDPPGDGETHEGFDTITDAGCAKNVLTVGAVSDAVLTGKRSLDAAEMAAFSGWGPTDDGRIKPDLVANGVGVYSTSSDSDDSYSTRTGTSSASANACGSAVLLVEQFRKLFPGLAMRASTLKGLLIHTADDLGNPGPDYVFGWGLMNTRAAADHLRLYAQSPQSPIWWKAPDSTPRRNVRVGDGTSILRHCADGSPRSAVALTSPVLIHPEPARKARNQRFLLSSTSAPAHPRPGVNRGQWEQVRIASRLRKTLHGGRRPTFKTARRRNTLSDLGNSSTQKTFKQVGSFIDRLERSWKRGGGAGRKKRARSWERNPTSQRLERLLLRADVGRLGAFASLSGHKFHLLAFLKCPETFGDDVGVMDEQIFPTTVGRNKTIPFLLVEPLDCTGAQITYSPGSDLLRALFFSPERLNAFRGYGFRHIPTH
jgi:hypothetical protein